MSYTYATYTTTIANLLAESETDPNFVQILPSIIDYAEQRIYRELDMLVEDVADSSASTTAGVRDFTLPTSLGVFQIVKDINIITPASTAPGSGTRNALTPVSRSVLDWSWPSSTGTGVPQQFVYYSQSALSGQPNIIFGPWPDATYRVEVIGKIIPIPLAASNTATFLSTYLPDVFLAASMIFAQGAFQKNFGSAATVDDQGQAISWESQYSKLRDSASTWEARKKFAGASWTASQVEPTAVPQRG